MKSSTVPYSRSRYNNTCGVFVFLETSLRFLSLLSFAGTVSRRKTDPWGFTTRSSSGKSTGRQCLQASTTARFRVTFSKFINEIFCEKCNCPPPAPRCTLLTLPNFTFSDTEKAHHRSSQHRRRSITRKKSLPLRSCKKNCGNRNNRQKR